MHFGAENLREDMLDLLAKAYSQGLHSRPKCVLQTLVTQSLPLMLSDYDPALISMGMLMIFPSLNMFVSSYSQWIWLGTLVKAMGETEGFGFVTEELMRSLSEVK